jgi:hypothetical protein
MNNYLIIGGGVTGVLMSNLLERKGIAFKGLEKTRHIGKEFNFGQFRLYQDNSVGILRDLGYVSEWTKIDDQAQERKKGEWVAAQSDFIDQEKAFLGAPYYYPTQNLDPMIYSAIEGMKPQFFTDKTVEPINLDKKTVLCSDGTEYPYERLAWCSDLNGLLKAVNRPSKSIAKRNKKNDDSQGAVHLEMEVQETIFHFKNTVVFPFRYKDYKLRALGINELRCHGDSSVKRIHWIVFIERELSEDREEVAKVLRALKRELTKEFEGLKTLVTKEKIVFYPKTDSYTPLEAKGLELFPDVFYVGPEIQLTDSTIQNSPLDLMLENCKRFQEVL